MNEKVCAAFPRWALIPALVILSACRGENVTVFAVDPIATCERALQEGQDGDPCTGLDNGCVRNEGCCFEEAYCEFGELIRFDDCSLCQGCVQDADCVPGAWCIGDECRPCPETENCEVCPLGLEPLVRNGCATCECVPASECELDVDCLDPSHPYCSIGSFCVCSDPGCCGNVCAPDACRDLPPPAGCVVDCPTALCASGLCRQRDCVCIDGGWVCEEVCTDIADAFCG